MSDRVTALVTEDRQCGFHLQTRHAVLRCTTLLSQNLCSRYWPLNNSFAFNRDETNREFILSPIIANVDGTFAAKILNEARVFYPRSCVSIANKLINKVYKCFVARWCNHLQHIS